MFIFCFFVFFRMAAATMTEDLSIAEILYQNFITDGPLSSSAHSLKQNGALRPQRRKYPEDGNDLGVLGVWW